MHRSLSALLAGLLLGCQPAPVACFVGFTAGAVLSTGCQARPPAATRFLALSDTWGAVKSAMTAYAKLANAGKIPPKDCDRIDAAYETFRASILVAIRAAQFDWNSPSNPELDRLAADVLALIEQLAKP